VSAAQRTRAYPLLLLLVAAVVACAASATRQEQPARFSPPTQQEAVELDVPGVENAYRVSADLHRGAQPTANGFAELSRRGIRTVVNLRLLHSDRDDLEKSNLAARRLGYVHIPMGAWEANEDQVVQFLRVVTDEQLQPVFVHCQHGSDRTGTMVAAYRIVVQGWSKEAAIQEMREGPFGFHQVWVNLPHFVEQMDVTAVRRRLGLSEN
jgi:protein tyrosine phosphatase (PTP) superfamily phosphohydrolase (DUF442 family)